MTVNPGMRAALLSAIDGSGDVDAESQVGFHDRLYEILGCDPVVKHRGGSGGRIEPGDDRCEIRLDITVPVRRRMHLLRRPQRATVPRVTQIHRLELQRHLQKLFELGDAVLIILAAAAHSEDDVGVMKAFRIAVTVKCISHRLTTSGCASVLAAVLVTRPMPMLVLARSSS